MRRAADERRRAGFDLDYDRPKSIGRLRGFHGNYGCFVRSYAYICSLGGDGLKDASEAAVLNANYLLARLARGRASRELPAARLRRACACTSSCSPAAPMKRELEIKTLDLAKRLLDYGFHPPTVYFPLLVDEALMVEPTETETKETLDAFADAIARDPARGGGRPGDRARRALHHARAPARRGRRRPSGPVIRQPLLGASARRRLTAASAAPVQVSPLCLGAMMFGGRATPTTTTASASSTRRSTARHQLHRHGRLLYSRGESEEIVGKALAGGRREPRRARHKVHGHAWATDPNQFGNTPRWIVLTKVGGQRWPRLKTDWIDLYQIHRPEPDTDIDETLGALSDLVRAGKVPLHRQLDVPAAQIVEAQWVAQRRGRERFVCEQPPLLDADRGRRRPCEGCRRRVSAVAAARRLPAGHDWASRWAGEQPARAAELVDADRHVAGGQVGPGPTSRLLVAGLRAGRQ